MFCTCIFSGFIVTITCSYLKAIQNKSKKKQLQNSSWCLTVLTFFIWTFPRILNDVIEILFDDWLTGVWDFPMCIAHTWLWFPQIFQILSTMSYSCQLIRFILYCRTKLVVNVGNVKIYIFKYSKFWLIAQTNFLVGCWFCMDCIALELCLSTSTALHFHW